MSRRTLHGEARRALLTRLGRPMFVNRKGREQECRLSDRRVDSLFNDPMTAATGMGGEVLSGWRRADLGDGCPFCRDRYSW